MKDLGFALMVHSQAEPLQSLKRVLKALGVETYSVQTCREAKRLVTQTQPELIFTEASLSDGSWADILELAREADFPLNVIVVSATKNTNLYLSVMEQGAYDFVVPPFEHEGLAFIVKSAEHDVRNRKEAQSRLPIMM